MPVLTIETRCGYEIKCKSCGWHEIPTKHKRQGDWKFNGNVEKPTFTPSMNECSNPPGPEHNPEVATRRCHFVITDGKIAYQSDCSHDLRGQTLDMLPYSETEVALTQLRKEENWK